MCFAFNLMNILFVNFAMSDADKKNLMMLRLSQCIDLFFHNKDSITIRFPVINIVDPKSIMTWLEIRKLVLATGSRFQIRIEIYTAFFMLITFLLDLTVFAAASFILAFDALHPLTWMYVVCNALVLSVFMLRITYPLSRINE